MIDINLHRRIIQPDSPLRHVPLELNARQKVYLDGIRYSVEIADAAHRRLRETLWKISSRPEERSYADEYVNAAADAWSIVDSLNRLRALCLGAPHFANQQFCREFVQSIYPVVQLRNEVQHLDGRIDRIVAANKPVWGTLGWVICLDAPPRKAVLHSLVPGSLRPGERRLVNPGGQTFSIPLDLITLEGDKASVSLSEMMSRTALFVQTVEEVLRGVFRAGVPTAHDLHIQVELALFETDTPSPDIVLAIREEQ